MVGTTPGLEARFAPVGSHLRGVLGDGPVPEAGGRHQQRIVVEGVSGDVERAVGPCIEGTVELAEQVRICVDAVDEGFHDVDAREAGERG